MWFNILKKKTLKMGGAITSTSGGNSATTRGIETFVRYGGDKDGEEDSEE
jgi:hypothetical protein